MRNSVACAGSCASKAAGTASAHRDDRSRQAIFIVETLWMLGKLHRLRIPMHHAVAFDTDVAEQSGTRCTEAEGRIFHNRLAIAYRVKEVMEVVVAVGIAGRRAEGLNVLRGRTGGMLDGILLAVLLHVGLLHGVGEGRYRVARFRMRWACV